MEISRLLSAAPAPAPLPSSPVSSLASAPSRRHAPPQPPPLSLGPSMLPPPPRPPVHGSGGAAPQQPAMPRLVSATPGAPSAAPLAETTPAVAQPLAALQAAAVSAATTPQPSAASAATATASPDTPTRGGAVKPFRCPAPGCGSEFGQKGSLTRHLKNRHSSNCRPHKCDLCSKTFSEKWTLNVHRRNVHLKLKAHHCPQCNKSFGEKWNLRKHINVVHLLVKPFACPICHRAFGYKGDMVKHVAELHSSDTTARPFVCNVADCGVKFARMRYLRRHQNLSHKNLRPAASMEPVGGMNDAEDAEMHQPQLNPQHQANSGASGSAAVPTHSPFALSPTTPYLPSRPAPLSAQTPLPSEPPKQMSNLALFAAVASETPPQTRLMMEADH